jgi:enamine deaminase RidA (YjgF/YER057c/UK114 family)
MYLRKSWLLTAAAVLVAFWGTACADERAYIGARSASDENVPPFSGGVMVGDTLYVSGALGLVDGEVPEDPADEARAVLDAIKDTLEQAGMTMDDLVSVQIFCSDVSNYGAFNGVYRTYFTKEFPARAFIGSGELLFGARFEVMGIAVKR